MESLRKLKDKFSGLTLNKRSGDSARTGPQFKQTPPREAIREEDGPNEWQLDSALTKIKKLGD